MRGASPTNRLDPVVVPGRTPGFTDADYAQAGGFGKESARRFRRIWLPPTVAAALRQVGFDIGDIETVGGRVPARLLHEMATYGFLDGTNAFEVTTYVSSSGLDPNRVRLWMQVPGSTLPVAHALHRLGASPNQVDGWVNAYRATPADLLAVLQARNTVASALRSDVNGWLQAAVADAQHRHPGAGRWSAPTPPPLDPADPGLGGLTGLCAAAQMSPTRMMQTVTDPGLSWQSIVLGVYTMAALACDDVVLPDPAWWERR